MRPLVPRSKGYKLEAQAISFWSKLVTTGRGMAGGNYRSRLNVHGPYPARALPYSLNATPGRERTVLKMKHLPVACVGGDNRACGLSLALAHDDRFDPFHPARDPSPRATPSDSSLCRNTLAPRPVTSSNVTLAAIVEQHEFHAGTLSGVQLGICCLASGAEEDDILLGRPTFT